MNKQGFTLMEILAVLLVVALIASMAMPVFRYVRQEMRYNQARSAAVKMAEAIRNYYQATRGYRIENCFSADADTEVMYTPLTDCNFIAETGIPVQSAANAASSTSQLFACGYLSARDFAGLPYEFCPCGKNGEDCDGHSNWIVRVTPTGNVAADYQDRVIGVTKSMSLEETIPGEEEE